MLLVCVFALLLVSFSLAAVEVSPAEKIVVDVDYGDLREDAETLTYEKTVTFTNTAEPMCPVECDAACEEECNAECEPQCADCRACITLSCPDCIEGEAPDAACLACMQDIETGCGDECLDCIECHEDFDTDGCITNCMAACTTDDPKIVTLATVVSSDYTALVNELPATELTLGPGESKTVTLTLTVPIDENSGSNAVGTLTWTAGEDTGILGIETNVRSMVRINELNVCFNDDCEEVDESGDKTDDIAPGTEVEFKVDVENLFDDKYDDCDLEDIELTLQFADEDDEDDFEDEIDEEETFDLDAEEETEVVLSFDVPGDAKEKSYELVLRLEAEDENGAVHIEEWTVYLEVDRQKDDVRIEKAELAMDTVVSGGETTLRIRLTNYGSNDQDDVALTVYNSALGIDVKEWDIEMDEDPDDDDNSYTKTVPIVVSEDVLAGTFTIEVRVFVDGDEEVDHRILKLTVAGAEEAAEEEEEETGEVIVQNLPEEAAEESGLTGAVVSTVETSQSGGMTAFMVVVVVLLVILIALMLGVLIRK